MPIETEPYLRQAALWPASGRHILAGHDEATIVVYQAYRPSIAASAVERGRLEGGGFSLSRMSWIKPGFLWMMYRSGWATKEGQERVLALRIGKGFFDSILARAVPSSWPCEGFASREEWGAAGARSPVRVQWDPDHDPPGAPLRRRAIQLGLRGEALAAFAREELREVIDLTPLVEEGRRRLAEKGPAGLVTPRERVYLPGDPAIAARLGISETGPSPR